MRTKWVTLMVFCFALLISQTVIAQYTGGSYDGYGMGTSESDIPMYPSIYVGGSYDGYGMGTSESDIPLPVTLSSFIAQAGDGEVTLHWVTESEIDNLGFHVYRALEAEGVYEQLTAEVLEGAGTSTGRREYAFSDVRLSNGVTYWYRLEDVAFDGTTTLHGPISVTPQAAEAAEVQALPTEFGLSQNVPNPFNPSTEIRVALPEARQVRLSVFNLLGQEVRVLVEGFREPGTYTVRWDGKDRHGLEAAAGGYVVRLEAGDFSETRRMVLIK